MAGTDYAKKKKPELEELLKARGLPTGGLKAEIVARLEEDDASKDASGTDAAPAAAEGDASAVASGDASASADAAAPSSAATSAPAAAAIAAGGQGRAANPVAVPNQVVGEDPAHEDLTVKPPKDFASGMADLGLADELARRKARAARFGTSVANADDLEKSADRAKRFGTGAAEGNGEKTGAAEGVIASLNQALPEERHRKRGRADKDDGQRKRQDSTPREKAGKPAAPAALSEADRAKAEARAKRFGVAS